MPSLKWVLTLSIKLQVKLINQKEAKEKDLRLTYASQTGPPTKQSKPKRSPPFKVQTRSLFKPPLCMKTMGDCRKT